MLEKLFSPMQINGCEIPNRLAVTGMVTNFCTPDGYITDQQIAYHEAKAKGGWGLIITEDYSINENGKGYERISGLYNDSLIEGNRKLTDAIHKYGTKIFCQIYHPGRQTCGYVNGGVQPVAPSPIPCPWLRQLPRELTVKEIKTLVKEFGDAALRAKKAAFDGIELHCGHGYLLAEFLSLYSNKRNDEYGGCIENRARIVKDVIEDIRSKVGSDFPVIVRISGDECVEGGSDISETLVFAKLFEAWGFDAINVSSGVYGTYNKGIVATMYVNHAWTTDFAAEVKKLVKIPVITANRINNPIMAETILELGKADFIGMGRGSLADPELPNKAKNGEFEAIRYCIGCLQGCVGRLLFGHNITCVVNPMIGREHELSFQKTASPKKVMVIGGGPGGMEAAWTAATNGHNVSIYEKQSFLGGQLKSAACPPCKGELSTFVSWASHELKRLGVAIYMDTEATEETVKAENPDQIIVATGGKALIPPIKGVDSAFVYTAEDILLGRVQPGNMVVIIGGGEVGCETAAYLAQQERGVAVLEIQPGLMNDMNPIHKLALTKILDTYRVKRMASTKVLEITEQGVSIESDAGVSLIPAEMVVLAAGYTPENALAEKLTSLYPDKVCIVGTAVKTSNALIAINEGFNCGIAIK